MLDSNEAFFIFDKMNKNKKLLIIGTVWPEPNSSAAGIRMIQLIQWFLTGGYEIIFSSSAQKSDFSFDLTSLGVIEKEIQLNDCSFDNFILDLQPDIVLFDRFTIEEKYGWRVTEYLPNTLKILDTEDLHSLRNEREKCVKENIEFNLENILLNDLAKREIASVYRCDLSLIISKFEFQVLVDIFRINQSLLIYLPFLFDELKNETLSDLPSFTERDYFITIGNFIHPPNYDAVVQIKTKIWPNIRKALPSAEMHIYGAYSSQKVNQLNNAKEGFLIKGRAEDVNEVMKNAKVCLSPLRFGAGLKGKIFDAMQNGTPNVTSSIGSEGISQNLPFGGFVEDDFKCFADKAIQLYSDENLWLESQQNGFDILNSNFNKIEFEEKFFNRINFLLLNIAQHRKSNFIGTMLVHHTLQSTKYMSKWIEEKNKSVN